MVKDILRIVFSHKTSSLNKWFNSITILFLYKTKLGIYIGGRGGGFLVHLAIGLLECRFAASVFMVYMLIKLRNVQEEGIWLLFLELNRYIVSM
jgi:hypothetical protein